MDWNFNINDCPDGYIKEIEVETKKGTRTEKRFVPAYVWAASKCGGVTKSYKTLEGRFSMFGTNEQPIAWQPYIIPKHPSAEKDTV